MNQYKVTVNNEVFEVSIEPLAPVDRRPAAPVYHPPVASGNAGSPAPAPKKPQPQPKPAAPAPAAPSAAASGSTPIHSPLPGTVLRIPVSQGQSVRRGDLLIVLEAMKMENEVVAPCDGVVSSISTTINATVDPGVLLCTLN